MSRHYVTFGQEHTHRINGITLDCDTVACYDAINADAGRRLAFDTFGDKFFTDYHGDKFPMEDLHYFPKGIVNIDERHRGITITNK